jgi:hypothetical protein
MSDKKPIPVGENHKRAISATLTLLDQMLCEFEEYARGRERRGAIYREHNALSEPQRLGIQAEIAAMRRTIGELKETLGLSETCDEAAQQIWGRASAFWEVLMESQTKYLRRYGEFGPELKEALDPRIEVLIARLLTLADLARNAGKRPAQPS